MAPPSDDELLIDPAAGEILCRGKPLAIQPGSLRFQAILRIGEAGSAGVAKEELFQRVWELPYRKESHQQLVYMMIRRLRQLVPVEVADGRYRFPTRLKVTVLTPSGGLPDGQPLIPVRKRRILELLERTSGPIARRMLVRSLGISARTALRELCELQRQGLLKRIGSGRAARYGRA